MLKERLESLILMIYYWDNYARNFGFLQNVVDLVRQMFISVAGLSRPVLGSPSFYEAVRRKFTSVCTLRETGMVNSDKISSAYPEISDAHFQVHIVILQTDISAWWNFCCSHINVRKFLNTAYLVL